MYVTPRCMLLPGVCYSPVYVPSLLYHITPSDTSDHILTLTISHPLPPTHHITPSPSHSPYHTLSLPLTASHPLPPTHHITPSILDTSGSDSGLPGGGAETKNNPHRQTTLQLYQQIPGLQCFPNSVATARRVHVGVTTHGCTGASSQPPLYF